ncbi:hypothetical protein SEA_WELCOME_88 [Microbacterium phage Welcome]|nr:hypothetical protein SEA_LYELL_86 [Microbacterium phage Lyell]QYC54205.1 hypothetical protein SEA_WELCOME_88 [Microbacterium phage Welcome]URM87489.1 hypothetical protein SEA_DUSTYDINO_90 [Microbacterium phage DustyDino]UVK62500.1 hypothetical protein SEA_YUMA_85 [Microbacterium phage Yuma]
MAASTEAEIRFIELNLVKTLDKKEVLATLREWRTESKKSVEVDLLNDLIERIESGELDG